MSAPNPGSDAALDLGCTCPVLDNGHGSEDLGRTRGFWYTAGCPVHEDARPKKDNPVPDDFRLPVISLWQPWAQWVSLGWKTIETRTHQRFSSLAGRRIGIHAALKWDDNAFDAAREFLSDAQRSATGQFMHLGGAVICTAFVHSHRELDPLDNSAALIDCTHITRYGLILRDVRMVEAIPAKGKQGIWYLPDYKTDTQKGE